MKKLLVVLLLIAGVVVVVSGQVVLDKKAEFLKQIETRLSQIEDLYFSKLTFEERRTAIKLVDEILVIVAKYDAVPASTAGAASTAGNAGTTPAAGNVSVLSDDAFAYMLKEVKGTIDDDKKIAIIKSIGKDGMILCAQLKKCLETFSFESGKVKCIKELYVKIADKANFSVVLSALTYDSSKQEVLRSLNLDS